MLVSWVKERHHLICVGIDAGEIRSFIEITMVTSQGQILELIITSMLAGNDVFDVKNMKGFVLLSQPANTRSDLPLVCAPAPCRVAASVGAVLL